MSLLRLTAAGMVGLTGPWVTPGHEERQALESVPETAVLIPHIDSAHQALLSAQGMSVRARMAPVIDAQTRADNSHDSLWRTLDLSLRAHIQLAKARRQVERVAELERAYLEVVPDDLSVVNMSYVEEVGEVRMLDARLSAESRQTMAGLTIDGSTLTGVVQELLDAAKELGRLTDLRADERQSDDVGVMADARNAWLRAVGMVRNMIEMSGTTNPVLHGMLARIRDAEQQAERRAAGQTPSEPPTEPDATPDDSTPSADPVVIPE